MDNNKFIYKENELELVDTQCECCEFYNKEKNNVYFIKKEFLEILKIIL